MFPVEVPGALLQVVAGNGVDGIASDTVRCQLRQDQADLAVALVEVGESQLGTGDGGDASGRVQPSRQGILRVGLGPVILDGDRAVVVIQLEGIALAVG